MKSTTVLVFPCGTEIGLELHRSLQYTLHVRLIGASSLRTDHGRYLYREYHDDVPFVDEPGFIPWLNGFIDRHGVEFVYPAHDSVVLRLGQEQERVHATVIGSPERTCTICRNKRLTYETFEGKIRTPKVYRLEDAALPYPLLLKPEVGEGSRGIEIAHTREEADFLLKRNPAKLLLEYLPGAEFTVDCFSDRHKQLLFVGGRERVRIAGGIAVDTRPIEAPVFDQIARTIQSTLELRGAWFFQLKRAADGELALLEIAPRIAGSMGMYRNLGINFALLSVYDRMGLDVSILRNHYPIRMSRALTNRFEIGLDYRHIYIDLDDTLVLDGRVNSLAIVLLHQCHDRGVQLHLMTRHRQSIEETLERHRLAGLFDEIILLDETTPKSSLISERDAIFIDDSFAERKEVDARCAIPTFGVDMIESLIDWSM